MIHKLKRKLSAIRANDEGAALIEFALIAGPLIVLLLGTMDLAYKGYVSTLSKSVMQEVARESSVGGKSAKKIEEEINAKLEPLLLSSATVRVSVKSYFAFTGIGKPEQIIDDKNSNGTLDIGDCFLDGNRNGVFDANTGNSGTGGPDDIVNYEIDITSPRFFPLAKFFGGENMRVYNATSVRNQPFGSQVPDPTVCKE